ncbi:MAG: hypothetical protein ACI4U2_06915 [Christensenellaceae bacterium]
MKARKILIGLFLCTFLLLSLCFPKRSAELFLQGTLLWATTVLPAVFPFLFSTSLLHSLGISSAVARRLSPVSRRFSLSGTGGCILMLSFFSGYPVGSKLLADSLSDGALSFKEADRLAPLCSSPSPTFLLGVLSALFDQRAGLLLWGAHLLALLVLCLIARAPAEESQSFVLPSRSVSETLTSSILSILAVGAYVALFSVLTGFLADLPLPRPISIVLTGLIEMTNGCKAACALPRVAALPLCSFFTTFGGAAVLLQQGTFLSSAHVNLKRFLFVKLLFGLLSAAITLLSCLLFGMLR